MMTDIHACYVNFAAECQRHAMSHEELAGRGGADAEVPVTFLSAASSPEPAVIRHVNFRPEPVCKFLVDVLE